MGELDGGVAPLAPPRAGQAVDARVEIEVLEHGQILVERELLAHVADLAADLLAVLHHVEPEHAGAPRARREQPAQDTDQRRLARAVGPEQPVYRPSGDRRLTSESATTSPNRLRDPVGDDGHISRHLGTRMSAAMPARSSILPASQADPGGEDLVGAFVGRLQIARRKFADAIDVLDHPRERLIGKRVDDDRHRLPEVHSSELGLGHVDAHVELVILEQHRGGRVRCQDVAWS